MKTEEILKFLYHEYFTSPLENKSKLSLGSEIVYCLANLKNFENLPFTKVIGKVKNRYTDMINEKTTSIEIDQQLLHIQYPIFILLERCKILFDALDIIEFKPIINDYNSFFTISCLIMYRIVFYNFNHLKRIRNKNIDDVKKDTKRVFEKNSLHYWFTISEISTLNKKIETSFFDEYIKLFSINAQDIESYFDVYKIYVTKKGYTLILLSDFAYYLYFNLENHILSKLKDSQEISCWGRAKGVSFERYLTNIIKSCIPHSLIYNNKHYIDVNGNKSEIDAIVEFDDFLLFVEAKSSRFDSAIPFITNNIDERFKNAFKKSYDSIDRFHKTIQGKHSIEIFDNKSSRNICLSGKKIISIHTTVYNIQYFSTEIQRGFIAVLPNYEFYPITINITDFYTILLESKSDNTTYKLKKYLYERFEFINEFKNVKFDVDEIDIYGLIVNNFSAYKRSIEMIRSSKIDNKYIDITITDDSYRKYLNNKYNVLFPLKNISNQVDVDKQSPLIDYYSKRTF